MKVRDSGFDKNKFSPPPILGAALGWRKGPVDNDGGVAGLGGGHVRGADETHAGSVRGVTVPQQLDLEVQLVEAILGTGKSKFSESRRLFVTQLLCSIPGSGGSGRIGMVPSNQG